MGYEVKVEVGQYAIDPTTWLDVRMTDMGAVLSVCDTDMNVRYTFMVDGGKLILGEVGRLVGEIDVTPDAVSGASSGSSEEPRSHDPDTPTA